MQEIVKKTGRILGPLLIYTAVSFLVTAAGVGMLESRGKGPESLDQALLTGITAAFLLPVFGRLWQEDRKKHLSSVKRRKVPVWVYGAVLLAGALAAVLGSGLIEAAGLKNRFSNEIQEGLFASALWAQLLGPGFLVPFMEEFLYRGLLYERMRENFSQLASMVMASLLFALGHGNLIQIAYALPMAFLLQLLYEKSGRLALPAAFHMGANLISIWVEYFVA